MLNQTQALGATYQPSLPAGSREGFLNRDEFFILLASLQAKLRMGDDLFQRRFAAHQEADARRGSTSTTYSYSVGLEEHLETSRTPEYSQQTKLSINRNPLPRGHPVKSPSMSDSIGSDLVQVNSADHEEAYADGFTEYHSPTFPNRLPSCPVELEDTGTGKQTQLGSSPSWVCSKCTYRNSFDSLACGICEFQRNIDLSSDKISTDGDGKMDYKEAVRFSLLPTLPEVVPPTLPEVMPEIESGLEAVETVRQMATPIQNPRLNPGVPETDAPIATKESDDRALALITAREPQQTQKSQQKKSTLNIKKISRSIMSGSRKSKESENPRSDPDLAASGFSLGGLAKILGDAVEAGNLPLVASILKLGADVNYSSRKEEECHYSASRGVTSKNYHVVEYLLKKGMNKKSAANALHQAIIQGNCIDIAMKLVPHADFNFMWAVKGDGDQTQESCLGALSRMNDEEHHDRLRLLQLIMEQPNFDAEKPATLLESASEKVALSTLACFTRHAGFAAVESLLLLLGETYKVTRQQRYGSPYVHVDSLACISAKYWQREPKQALELAHLLLKHGSRLTGVKEKYTPLVPAIVGGCVSGVRLLLEMGADPECVMCSVGWSTPLSPLSYAAQEPSISMEISRALVYKGATPWRPDGQGRTALYWACRAGHFEAMQYLLMLDVARSNINKCLEAAVDSHNPEVARELVNIGAYATAATWKHVMSLNPVGSLRTTYLEIIDILLSTKTKLQRELVLAAIDYQNFWGLNRILETRKGILDFEEDTIFANPRWSGVVCKANRSFGPKSKKYGWGTRKDLQTCLAYAEEKNAHDIIALLKSYEWGSQAVCEADCALKLWEDACSSTPPHRVQNCYTIEVAEA
jgi:ankyrin repeat protein